MRDITPSEIREKLFSLRDLDFKEFHSKLLPTINPDNIIGVRLPLIRKLAVELLKTGNVDLFLNDLPHKYLDENQLHSFIIDKKCKTYDSAIEQVEKFLPFIDNWSLCDSFKPKALKMDINDLYSRIEEWLKSSYPYTVRFALVLLLNWFLDKDFDKEILSAVKTVAEKWASIENEGSYYVDMAIAWFYSVALVKQYEATIKIIEKKELPIWIHNKAIQKALDSFRIDESRKKYLKSLKIK